MPSLLHWVGKHFVRQAVKYGGNVVGLGFLGDLAVDVWEGWSRETDEGRRRAEVQRLAQAPDATREAAAVADEVAAGQSPEVRQAVAGYLAQVPALLRRAMARPADPSGRTIPAGLALRKADDLLALLPVRPARFRVGQRPLPGTDWELVELLGVGGFGEVWKAKNPFFDSVLPVALKFCLDPEGRDRLLRHEAAVLNQVLRQGRHPNIVALLHTYLSADPPCLAYELVEGGDLAGLIQDSGGLPAAGAIKLLYRLAHVVGHAHRLSPPIVHRDLKPANVLLQAGVGGHTEVKIADFGIGGLAATQAIRAATQAGPGPAAFQATVARGAYSLLYACPQQVRGEPPDPRDDVFALGVIGYQLLTGDLATGRPGGARWKKALTDRGASEGLIALLEACFEDDPADRPADAAVLAEALDRLLAPAITAPGGGTPVQYAPLFNFLAWWWSVVPVAWMRDGPRAVEHAKRACALTPDRWDYLDTLAAALAECGRFEEAAACQRAAIAGATPDRLEGCRQRLSLYESGRPCRADLPEVKKNAAAYQREGWEHVRAGDWGKAMTVFFRALLVNTKCVEAFNGLAWLWATCPEDCLRDGAKAVEYGRRYCELTGWKSPYALDTLAAAYAEAGQFNEAVRFEEKALEVAPSDRRKAYRARIQLYRAGKPHRITPEK